MQSSLDAAAHQLESGDTEPPLRFAGNSDWVRTTSGKWVRGSVDWMREDILSFDSDEFGEVEINMREVAEIHAANTHTYLLDERNELVGPAMIIPARNDYFLTFGISLRLG